MSSSPRPPRRFDHAVFVFALVNLALLVGLSFVESVLPPPQRLLAALPLWLLLPFALVRRRPRLWIVLGVSVPVLLVALGMTYHPAGSGSVRVVTLSTFHGARGPQQIADALRAADADIICLQDASGTGRLPDPVPTLESALTDYRFVRQGAFVIASRHPIYRVEPLSLPGDPHRVVALTATVTLPTGVFTVATTRRGKGLIATQGAQIDARIEALAAWSERQSGPMIVCGDFLTPLDAPERQRLTSRLTDAFTAAGSGFGWTSPDRLPLVRVDYILAGGGVTPVACRTLDAGLSDHRGVVAEFSRP